MRTILTVAITAKSAFGEDADISEILSQLREFNGPELFGTVSKLLYLIISEDSPKVRLQLEQDLLSPQIRLLVQDERRTIERQGGSAVCFYRRSLLVALKLIGLASPVQGGTIFSEQDDYYRLGKLLLRINDIAEDDSFATKLSDVDLIDTSEEAFAALLASFLLENPLRPDHEFSRYYKILFEYLPARFESKGLTREWLDLRTFDSFGVSLFDWFAFAFGISIMTYVYPKERFRDARPGVQTEALLANMKWPQSLKEKLVGLFSLRFEDLGLAVLEAQSFAFKYDFEVFRNRPLLRTGNALLVTDRELLLDHVGGQMLERIASKLERKQFGDLMNCVGLAFEDYCGWLLQCAQTNGYPKLEPLSGHGKKRVDFEISDHGTRIFFEVAKGTLGAEIRSNTDPRVLAAMLERLVGEVEQLAKVIVSYALSGKCGESQLVPVLVGMDRSLGFFFVQSTLNRRFQEALA